MRFYTNATLLTVLLISLLTVACTTIMPTAHILLKPCATEDSVECYWDGQTRGNGHGRSFWTDRHGTIHFL